MVLAPIVRGRKGEYRKELSADHAEKRFSCASSVDGTLHEIEDVAELPQAEEGRLKHDIDVVVDRIVVQRRAAAAASPIPSKPR